MNTWIMLYLACALSWAIISISQIMPFVKATMHGTPFDTKGMSEKRAEGIKTSIAAIRKKMGSLAIPDSWLTIVFAVTCTLVCLKQGLFWPYTMVSYIWKRSRDK